MEDAHVEDATQCLNSAALGSQKVASVKDALLGSLLQVLLVTELHALC